jgi:hypothetical protein
MLHSNPEPQRAAFPEIVPALPASHRIGCRVPAHLIFNSPTQRKVASSGRGRSKRVSAMTDKAITLTLEFIVPTALAIVLAVSLSVCAVYLTDCYLGPIEQAEAYYSAPASH